MTSGNSSDALDLGPLDLASARRVETLNSIYILEKGWYVRLARIDPEGTGPRVPSERMTYGAAHPLLGASWLFWPSGELAVRIRPSPPVGRGIGLITSPVVAVDGLPAAAFLDQLMAEISSSFSLYSDDEDSPSDNE